MFRLVFYLAMEYFHQNLNSFLMRLPGEGSSKQNFPGVVPDSQDSQKNDSLALLVRLRSLRSKKNSDAHNIGNTTKMHKTVKTEFNICYSP